MDYNKIKEQYQLTDEELAEIEALAERVITDLVGAGVSRVLAEQLTQQEQEKWLKRNLGSGSRLARLKALNQSLEAQLAIKTANRNN